MGLIAHQSPLKYIGDGGQRLLVLIANNARTAGVIETMAVVHSIFE
ncbi:hypothetical protein [Acidithrix sp. C25]|nr:hypothetical protein [Acidithrix sp. C25]CAG4905457.1 unnamed protein product [Acidithrix sp. C25]